MPSRAVITQAQAKTLADYIVGLPVPFTLTWKDGASRTLSQNALLHKWYGEIAKREHDSADAVKGRCHIQYGLPIKMRDAQWAWVWNQAPPNLNYEQKCKLMASGVLTVSSGMTTTELTEYMNAMQRDYLARGVNLTIPEDSRLSMKVIE